jgi:hypothetical protein
VPWDVPLDEDREHATYDPDRVSAYFAAATQAALALTAFRAPYRGRSTPVNAWWGTFDLAVVFYSGNPADPAGDDFITRNSGDAELIEVGWWPGDPKEDVRGSADPQADVLAFLHSAFRHACEVCGWDAFLAGSAEGHPPPILKGADLAT